MEILQGKPEELQEDPVMLALIERQTPEGSEAAQTAYEQRLQERVLLGDIDPQRLALYGMGLVALTADENEVLFAVRYPQEIA